MAKIISTHSFRGGTGKSNTTANLAVLVARAGHRVGVIDTDIQSPGIHVIFQLAESRVARALNDYLWGKCSIKDAAYDVTEAAIGNVDSDSDRPRIFLIPSSINVGEIGRILKEGYRVDKLNDGFQRLLTDLQLDYLFIDTHPGVNEETLLSIAISDTLLLIMRPDSQDFQGTAVTAELARRLEIPEMLMVINKVPPGMDTVQLRERVEKAYGAEVAAILPMNYEIVRLGSSGIFVNRFPDHPMTLALEQIAAARARLRENVMSEDDPMAALDDLLGGLRSAVAPFRATLNELHEKYRNLNEGKVADYIPELALADPSWFGISVVTVDGQVFDIGDYEQPFSIQSVSKPFVFGMALEDHGREGVLKKVGVEPTGEAFNAIVLDEQSNRPFNPLVNAGAIATADLIQGKDYADRVKRLLGLFGRYFGREVYIDNAIFMSERTTGHRNRAIAHLMLNFGMVSDRVEESLELYFQQCSILVTAHDLASMGATLANAGVNPLTKQKAIGQQYVKDVLSVMLMCGMYDYAGEWAYRVGLPAKSGVGGGICAVVPGRAGIGIFSPLLDARGNSVRGIKVCEELSSRFGLHAFELGFDGDRLEDQFRLRKKA